MRTPKQRQLVRYNAIEGADSGRLLQDWLTSTFSGGSPQIPGLRVARYRSRDLATNNDYVRGAVQSICNNVLGESGITFQAKVPQVRGGKTNQKINDQIEALWNEWAENPKWCHTGGKLTLLQLEHLILRTIIIDGEVLVRLVDERFDGSPVPLSIDVIDPDCLADMHWAGQRERIFQGIEVDKNYRPLNYWIYRNHPQDAFIDPWQDAPDAVPAGEILHLFVCDRTKQMRGKPWLVSSLKRMQHLGNYEEAEVVKARAQAAITGFIQSPQPEPFGPAGEDDEGNPNIGTVVEFEPGTIMQLQPGEEFQGFSPTAPESGLGDFLKHMLRGFAAGIGVGYAPVSRDYSEANYSSERSSKLEEHSAYRLIQKFLIDSFRVPLYHAWLDQAHITGALSLPNYELQERQYRKAKFTGKTFDWVDPQKDIAACKDAIKGGLSTLTNELAKRGLDLEETVEQLKQEKELCKDLFLDVFLPDPAPPMGAGEPAPEVAKGLKKIERSLIELGNRLGRLEDANDLQATRLWLPSHGTWKRAR
jgi:lambda family phage portal protein